MDALRAEDAVALLGYRGNPEVARYQSWRPRDIREAVAWIEQQNPGDVPVPGEWFQRALRLRSNGQLIGDLGVRFPAHAADAAEMGITLAPAWQGQGFAYEGLRALLDWLFGACGVRRVTASVDPRNAPCMALMQRLGLRLEAHVVNSFQLHGEWVDDAAWAIHADEWTGTHNDPAKADPVLPTR